MKYPIEIRKVVYASVVPVVCGNERGTAFLLLLTRWLRLDM